MEDRQRDPSRDDRHVPADHPPHETRLVQSPNAVTEQPALKLRGQTDLIRELLKEADEDTFPGQGEEVVREASRV